MASARGNKENSLVIETVGPSAAPSLALPPFSIQRIPGTLARAEDLPERREKYAPGYGNSWRLFLDMNGYFAACEQQDRPQLRGRPVGIVPVMAEHTSLIAASYEAKCSGVGTGTSVRDALRLCPNIVLVEARPYLYREIHFAIRAAVETVSPLDEVLSVDEMTVRMWRNERRLHDALRFGQAVQDAIRYHVGEWLTCSIGLAPNPFLAKVASDLQKPRGLSVLDTDDLPHKVRRLALTDWPGIGKRMAIRFERAGVQTTEDMYRVSMPVMRTIFGGIVGERWYRLIRGDADVVLPQVKRRQVGHSNVLSPELRTPAGAWSVAVRMLEKCAERLRAEQLHARALYVGVRSYNGESWGRKVKFSATTQTWHFVGMLKALWTDAQTFAPINRPSHVEVALLDVIPDRDVLCSLFAEDEGHERRQRLDAVVDAINGRFGRGKIFLASAMPAVKTLDHGRIPFGPPSKLG